MLVDFLGGNSDLYDGMFKWHPDKSTMIDLSGCYRIWWV